MVGSRGFEPRSARSERAASANCATSRWWPRADSNRHWTGSRPVASARLGYMATGPSGWTRTTTSRVKSPACCVDTTEGSGADPGDRTRTSAIPGPQASVTSDQHWSEWRDSNPHLKAWKARRHRYPTFALVRPRVSIVDTRTERGPVAFTGPGTPVSCQRPHSCELVWRQRQDSNPDPRGLEARMLPLHHAVVPLSRLDCFRDKTSP